MLEPIRLETGRIVDLRFASVNCKAEKLLGIQRGDALGKHLDHLFPELSTDECFEMYRKVIDSGNPSELQFSRSSSQADGSGKHFHLQATRVEQGIILNLTDMSHLRSSQEELERALEYKRAIVACTPFCTIVTDQNGLITQPILPQSGC